jgi:PAS domain S-box-containing protein
MHLTRSVLMILPLLSTAGALASPSGPINVLVMHWYDRRYPSNETFDRTLQDALQSLAPEGVEYYSEYLETNRFPGDDQARLLSEYLRKKYAGRRLDVIISGVSETLDFLFKYRHELFPAVPIVFATERPVAEAVRIGAGAAGFTFGNAYAKTLNLALKWHPGTEQLFVVSGTLNHDKAVESIVRDDLRQYESVVTITYLTDLAPDELTARIRTLPKNSVILYVWQQVLDAQGRLLETQDVLARVAHEAKVPIYGRTYAMIGRGIVGGYVWTQEGNAAKLAGITMRVVNGTRPKDIPVEKGPETPMFDWRQLQRWGIAEDRLPPGSVIRFRDLPIWQQYKWRIIGTIAILVLQAFLISALLVLRKREQRRAAALIEARRVLRESEQQLVSIYNTVRDVVFYVAVEANGQYRFVSVNEAFLAVTGLSRDAVVGKRVNDVIPEPSLTMVLEKYQQAVEKKAAVFWEETSDYPTGRLTGEVSLAPVLDNQGNCSYLVGSVHDITERKRSEATLRESQERFRIVADAAPVMIWMSGLDKLCTFVNRPWLEFTGRTIEQELGNGWADGVYPEDLNRCLAVYFSSFEARRSFQMEYRLRRAGGEYRLVLDSGTPLYRRGDFAGYIGSCVDVTEARRAQEESFARQKLESLGTLASGIAHDFNNLLGATLAQAELALAELASGSYPDEQLKEIREVAIRGSDIVRQLMIYAGQEGDVLELTDVSRTVEGMLGLLKVTIARHAQLVTDLGENLPAVKTRAAQLRQVVMNLVVNASDALKGREGLIRVSTTCVTIGPDTAGGASGGLPPGEYVELRVLDTGIGMAPETQARVFDPFFSTKSAGRGLGLPVVHGIIKRLNGAISVFSELNKGTTFQILLPSAGAAHSATADMVTGIHEAAEPFLEATVLLVEDEHPLRVAVAKMLSKAGFRVLEVDNGSDAIEVLRTDTADIDLILLDMTIPGTPSDEVLAEAARVRPKVKIVLTSAYSVEMAMAVLNGPQVRGFVRKPFQFGTLVQTVRNVLSSKAAA